MPLLTSIFSSVATEKCSLLWWENFLKVPRCSKTATRLFIEEAERFAGVYSRLRASLLKIEGAEKKAQERVGQKKKEKKTAVELAR